MIQTTCDLLPYPSIEKHWTARYLKIFGRQKSVDFFCVTIALYKNETCITELKFFVETEEQAKTLTDSFNSIGERNAREANVSA